MTILSVPWRYRIVTRQTVPILIGLTGLLLLLIALGYFFAREQILNTVDAQVRQFSNTIMREDESNRRWLRRTVPMLLQKIAPLLAERTVPEHVLAEQLTSFMRSGDSDNSDDRGKLLIEIVSVLPEISQAQSATPASSNLSIRRYAADGLMSKETAHLSISGIRSKGEILSKNKPYWPSPYIDDKRLLHLRYSLPLTLRTPSADGSSTLYSSHSTKQSSETIGILTASLAIPLFTERIRSLSFFKQCIPFFLTKSGRWTLPPSADIQLKKYKEHILNNAEKYSLVDFDGQRYVAITQQSSEQSLLIGVLVPYVDLFGYLGSITKFLMILGMVVLLLAAYVLRKTCNSLLSPLPYLAKMAERLSQGHIDPQFTTPVGTHFSPETEQLLTATKQLGIALNQRMHDLTVMTKTSERMHGELELARTIQNSLRPAHLPQMANVSLAAGIHAAREVCGDMYDCFTLSDHELCCVIGNVAEHGLPAALLTNRVFPLLHELLLDGVSPVKALSNVNAGFSGSNLKTRGISCFVGILNTQSGLLNYASAGQFPPFVINENSLTQLKIAHDKPLGIDVNSRFTPMSIQLTQKQTLFFIPQRLLSIQNRSGKSYIEVGLPTFFSKNHPTPSALVDAFYEDITHFTENNVHADVLLFALKFEKSV